MSIPFTLRLTVDVDGFSLRIDESFEATAVALFGPSGAGKTTILDAIAGFRAPDRGAIRIGARTLYSSADGIDVRSRDRHVGYVPQDLAIFPHLRVRGNILYGAGRGADETALERVTGLLEIQDLLGRRVDRLSGGERQRVALARALMSRPDVLLLDEPLAALHASLRQRIIPYLERIRDELRVPIVYVSHDEAELRRVADWVISLERGSVTASGPIASLSPPPSPANRSTP